MGVEHRVVRLHDGRGDLGGGVDGEPELRLLPVLHGQPFHEQGGEPGPGAATKRVEN